MNREDVCFKVIQSQRIHPRFVRLVLQANSELKTIRAGQFAQVRVQSSLQSWLRLPISIHDFNTQNKTITLLIQEVGEGSAYITSRKEGDVLQILYPLGNGFKLPKKDQKRILIVGGGCGIAPLYGLLKEIRGKSEYSQTECLFLIGAKTALDVLLKKELKDLGAEIFVCTEDGSIGEKGLVTDSYLFEKEKFDKVYICGPTPMMKAVLNKINPPETNSNKTDLNKNSQKDISQGARVDCEVSLENKMACGIGACLCCVTSDKDGHNRCVCTDGPVFDSSVLGW